MRISLTINDFGRAEWSNVLANNYGQRFAVFLTIGTKKRLEKAGLWPERKCDIIFVQSSEPDEISIGAAAREYTDMAGSNPYNFVMSIGGGATIDTVKAVLAVSEQSTEINWTGSLNSDRTVARVPHIAVPTTVGSGAEVSNSFVMKAEEGRKIPFVSERHTPNEAILDSRFTSDLTDELYLFGLVDALVHGLESGFTRLASAKSKSLSKSSLEDILKLLGSRKPSECENESERLLLMQRAQYASFVAGVAQSIASSGVVHAVAHWLSSVTHMSHARLVALSAYLLRGSEYWSGVLSESGVDGSQIELIDSVLQNAYSQICLDGFGGLHGLVALDKLGSIKKDPCYRVSQIRTPLEEIEAALIK